MANNDDLGNLFRQAKTFDKYQSKSDRENYQRQMDGIRREFDEEFDPEGRPRDGKYRKLED